MTITSASPVVVGVDESPGSLTAVRYAVAEALRADASVRLVHVAPDYTPTSPMLPLIRDDFELVGQRILRQAAAELAGPGEALGVATELRVGSTARNLLDAAADARLLVLGREHHSWVESIFTGSTSVAATGNATCPVVSVPASWTEAEHRGRVVVGLRSPGHPEELLAHAFAEAAARDGRLVVLHAWKLPGPYDDVVEARTHANDRVRDIEAEIDPLLDTLRRSHPEVEVELVVVHEQPVRALLRAAVAADLLVILRRDRGLPLTSHLGGTARTLLHEAECPVEVVPPPEVLTEMEGLVLEEATTVRK